MTTAQNDFIKGIAKILNIRDERIIKKGVDLIALLATKSRLNCSATCKGVICLDIASSFFPEPIKKEDAIKYSGCKKKIYINMYNNISKLLNLEKIYSIKEVCLLTNVCSVIDSASKLFEKFKNHCNKTHYDFEHPMYSSAAVWAVCRKNKIKVNHCKLVEISRLKKWELDELTKKFEELIELEKKEEPKEQEMSEKIKNKSVLPSLILYDVPRKRKQSSDIIIMTDEEYSKWKRKMLEE